MNDRRRWGDVTPCILALAVPLVGCRGPQSALDPAGEGASRIVSLFEVMAVGTAVVWVAMVVLTVYAMRANPEAQGRKRRAALIVGGGVVVPTVTLTALLVYGLAMLPSLVAPAPDGSLRIDVTGEQWWWRVRYPRPDGTFVELANELHLPRGEVVDVRLDSADVIHSFWVPSLGGKLDMFPGRVNRLALRPTRDGVYRGACAEYCGASHALMGFHAVVEDRASFDRWLARQAEDARAPEGDLATRGRDLFLSNGCGACHAVRGTPARGAIGPDLTHVGSRQGLGAATLGAARADFTRWITHTDTLKPGVTMPNFRMLPRGDVEVMAAWLEGLR